MPERRCWNRDEIGHADRAVETGQLGGEVLEDQPEQERVPLGLIVAHDARRELPEVQVRTALPAAGHHGGGPEGWPEGPGASMSRSRTSRFSRV